MNPFILIFLGVSILAGIIFYLNRKERKRNSFQTVKIPLEILEKEFNKIDLKSGTLRFWGNWFGKPMDNYHEIVNIEYNRIEDILVLILDESDKITIWKPTDIEISQNELKIQEASKILFEWYLYGQNKIDENLRFESYKKDGFKIEFDTNFMPDKRKVKCNISHPALSITQF